MQAHEFPQCFVAAGLSVAGAPTDWLSLAMQELGQSQTSAFLAEAAKWAALGALLGIALAVFACIFFARLGWYDLNWRFARGLRWTIYSLTVLLSALFFGLVGFWHGAIKGGECLLTQSQLAAEVLPQLADAVADGMACVQIYNLSGLASSADLSLKLEEFRAGKWELNAPQFLEQFDALQPAAVADLGARLEASALEANPQLKGGVGEKKLHALLQGMGRAVAEKKISSELKKYDVDQLYSNLRKQLLREALKTGDPDTLSHAELSAFLLREGLAPGLLKPVRVFARSQQRLLVMVALLGLVLPPLGLRLLRNRLGGSRPSAFPTPPRAPRGYP